MARVRLQGLADGTIAACFEGHAVGIGKFSPAVAARAQELGKGLPLAGFSASSRTIDKELARLVRQLARRGLLEFRLALSPDGPDQAVIEPQVADYWPRAAPLRDADVLTLSRFAYMRRRGSDMVLESPRADALFRMCDPALALGLAMLSAPRPIGKLRRQEAFPGLELLGLLVDCRILLKVEAGDSGLRPSEGDRSLVLWDFHDLLFHARSTQGRHANPVGGVYPFAALMPPLPAVRPRWPGKKADLRKLSGAPQISPLAALLRKRHSTRDFDHARPITVAEVSGLLDATARVLAKAPGRSELEGGPAVEYAPRPYPGAGAAYELELYLGVHRCEGLARGFYHYDAAGHALIPVAAQAQELEALLVGGQMAMGAAGLPQILIVIAARFGRLSWKYSSVAYSLVLKDVGVLTQTLYLMATEMGLGGCAIGLADIDLFAKMTGLAFHVEGPVGQFAIGRAAAPEAPA